MLLHFSGIHVASSGQYAQIQQTHMQWNTVAVLTMSLDGSSEAFHPAALGIRMNAEGVFQSACRQQIKCTACFRSRQRSSHLFSPSRQRKLMEVEAWTKLSLHCEYPQFQSSLPPPHQRSNGRSSLACQKCNHSLIAAYLMSQQNDRYIAISQSRFCLHIEALVSSTVQQVPYFASTFGAVLTGTHECDE